MVIPRPFRSRFSIRMWQTRNLLGQLFYKVGEAAEVDFVHLGRFLRAVSAWAGQSIGAPLGRAFGALDSSLRGAGEDICAPFRRAHSGAGHLRRLIADERQNGLGHALRLGAQFFGEGVRANAYLARNLLYYVLPLAAGGVFLYTVTTVLGGGYALAVQCNGATVGYVQQESVYEEAAKMVEDQIIYTGDEQPWTIEPTFNIVAANKQTVSDSQTLANAILENSGAQIAEATGLYVDGTFYGATADGDKLAAAIDAIKAPYLEQNPGADVQFVKDIKLRKGLYLTQSIKDYSEIEQLITAPVQGQQSYTIKAGDTPWSIAGANGITLDELYALNPVLDNGNNLPVGQELVIGQNVSFLQVKVVKTQVEQESIPYDTVKTNDSSLAYGKTKTTQAGVNGVREVTYQYTYIDGSLIEKVAVGDPVVVSQPVQEQISVGTYVPAAGVSVSTSGGSMMFPVGAGFKYMSRGFSGVNAHNGLDLCAAYGTPIYAAQAGTVVYAGQTASGYGIHVIINHGGGVQTLYGHCSGLVVSVGQTVAKGQLIAYVGATGTATGNHCHFEVIVNGTRVNGAPYIGIG